MASNVEFGDFFVVNLKKSFEQTIEWLVNWCTLMLL